MAQLLWVPKNTQDSLFKAGAASDGVIQINH
jgi:hypothetical protein